MVDEAFAASFRVYESMLDDLSPAETENLAALLEKVLKRLDHLSQLRQPWTTPT